MHGMIQYVDLVVLFHFDFQNSASIEIISVIYMHSDLASPQVTDQQYHQRPSIRQKISIANPLLLTFADE